MQFDLFESIEHDAALSRDRSVSRPDGPAWDITLTRRTRVLLHALPILNLKLADAKRDPELHHYDSLALAMKSLDLIIENTGLDAEIDAAGLVGRLSPLLTAMDSAKGIPPDADRHRAMVEKMLASLRYESNNRRPFSVEYQDFDAEGASVRRVLEFRIIEDVFHPRGGTVLLFCTLAKLRARQRGKRADRSSVLLLDNPIGHASRVRFLTIQQTIARVMGVQLIFTTGINDPESLAVFPNIIRLKNQRIDRNTGHRMIEPDEETPVHSRIEGVRLVREAETSGESLSPPQIPS